MNARLAVPRLAVRCLAVFALAAGASAQVEPLFAPPLYPSLANVRGATPGDVNEDGFPDLVVWGNGPAVMLSLAGNGFAPPVSVGGSGISVHLADLDHNGHLDLIATNAFLDVVSIGLGAGDGTFGPYDDYGTVADLRDVAVGDFNGDGNLDLAAPGLHALRVSILLGNGDGTFAPEVSYGPVGDYASAITAADLSGDGVLDLAVSSGNDAQVSLLLGNGDGSFAGAAPVIMPGGVDDVGAIDLDGDGDLDLVVSMVTLSQLRVVSNVGRGVFAHQSFAFPLPSSVNSLLVVRDFDEDGRDDVAIGIGADDMVCVFRSTGLADAAALQLQGTYLSGRSPLALSCADMDLDGDLDLIASDFAGNDVRILRGEGDGGFRTAAGPWSVGVAPLGVAAGDFNEDGRMDVVSCGTGSALSVTLNAGNGYFPTASAWPVPAGTRSDALVADFNGDGHADVATANSAFGSEGATIVLGAGNGQSLAVKTFQAAFGSWAWIDAADFDHDGNLDIVLGQGGVSGAASLQVAFNDGAGNLSAGPLLDTQFFSTQGVCARDFNNDGKPDIAVTHDTFPGRITVFLGNGAGGFSAPIATESSGGQRDLAAADFNHDGKLDLAISAYYGEFAVHAGNGDGTFGPATTYGFLPNSYGLAIGDVDHDGLEDVVTADNHQFEGFGSLSVLIGNGNGSFQPAVQFRTGRSPWQVAVADLDGDGWNDLVTAPAAGTDVLLNRRGPWNELYHGLTGTQGIPRQIGTGTMVHGQPFNFTLRDARPLTQAFHVIGVAPLMHAFKGGTMVPTFDFINTFPVTNALGTVVLAGPWINAPSGLTLYFQFWMKDPQGPLGFAGSTAVSATLP